MKRIYDEHLREINRNVLNVWTVICAVLSVAYIVEIFKHNRSIGYVICFLLILWLPHLHCRNLYQDGIPDLKLQYGIAAGYFLMYAFAMATGKSLLVFSYILPLLSFLVLFHKPTLILLTGIASVLLNIGCIVRDILNGKVSWQNSRDVEIQLGILLLCFFGAYLCSSVYDKIFRANFRFMAQILSQKTEIREKSDALKSAVQTARTDALTGLQNRLAYLECMVNESETQKVGVLFCDANGLKYVNDREGHGAGDVLLLQVAASLRQAFGSDHCFRISGDEFVVLLPSLSEGEFVQRAEVFHQKIWSAAPPSLSVGWCYGSLSHQTVQEAEQRMYEDKADFYLKFPHMKRT